MVVVNCLPARMLLNRRTSPPPNSVVFVPSLPPRSPPLPPPLPTPPPLPPRATIAALAPLLALCWPPGAASSLCCHPLFLLVLVVFFYFLRTLRACGWLGTSHWPHLFLRFRSPCFLLSSILLRSAPLPYLPSHNPHSPLSPFLPLLRWHMPAPSRLHLTDYPISSLPYTRYIYPSPNLFNLVPAQSITHLLPPSPPL